MLDTLVKRACVKPSRRDKINHPYLDMRPDAVRGKRLIFTMASGKRSTVTSPTFSNSRNMTIPTTLGVIIIMKHINDPFVHWPLGVYYGGAMAPAEVMLSSQGATGKAKISRGGSQDSKDPN